MLCHWPILIACLCTASIALAQPSAIRAKSDMFAADEAVQVALEQSPALGAARRRVEAATAALRGAGAPYTPRVELAPGAGFTNGNALLSQQFDIAGLRTAQTQRAAGEQSAAQAQADAVRLQVVLETRTAYFDLVRARASEATARDAVGLTEQVQTIVRRRVQLGEAPAVQATRAEIEVARAQQEFVRAQADTQARAAILNRLLGRERQQPIQPTDSLTLPPAPRPLEEQVAEAMRLRPDLRAAQARLAALQGEVEVARAQGRPTLFAEVAADTWSLDRAPFSGRNLGVQGRLNFPLGRDRAQRAEVDRTRAVALAQEAEVEVLRRAIAREIEQAAADLTASRQIAQNYEQTILPRTAQLLSATRAGFESGLTTFLEVLEAQRVARQTQVEYQTTLFEAVRARTTLDAALGAAILGPTPMPPIPARQMR